MPKSTVAISLLIVFCSACLLVQEEDNFIDVEKTPNPAYIGAVKYSITGGAYFPLGDTLWLSNSAYLDISGGVVYDYEVSIDGEVIRPFGKGRERFTLEKGDRQSGTYKLEIAQRVKSGTNSLADKADVEYVEYKRPYALMVGDPEFVPEITSIQVVNGTLRINWKSYMHGNFEGFVLRKFFGTNNIADRQFMISDHRTNYFIDSTYVGGNMRYELEINEGGAYKKSAQKSIYIPYLPKFLLTKVSETRLKFSWNAPSLINNVDHFRVSIQGETLQDNIAPSARSIEFNGANIFGEIKGYSITMEAKVPDGRVTGSDRFSVTEQLLPGERLPGFRSIKYSNAKQSFFLTHEQNLSSTILGVYKLDDNLRVVDSTAYESVNPTEFYLSPNGSHMYLLTGKNVEQFDVGQLSNRVTHTLADLGIPSSYFNSFVLEDYFGVSNNNVLLLNLSSWTYLVDMNQRKVILQLPPRGHTHLSADGKYFVNNTSLYRANSETYTLDATLPYSTIKYVQFFDDEPSLLLIVTDSRIVKYDCESKTEVIGWDVNASAGPRLDQSSKKLFYYLNEPLFPNKKVALFDLEKGTVEKQVIIRGDWVRFKNNILFDRRGFALRDY